MKKELFTLSAKVVLQHGNQVLLLHSEDMVWDIPGGALDYQEIPLAALKREVKEEMGLDSLPPLDLIGIFLAPIRKDDRGVMGIFYHGKVTEKPEITLSNEHTHLEWVEGSVAAQRLAGHFPAALTEWLKAMY